MDDYAHEKRGGMHWIREQFALMLGLTPEAIEWEQHSYGALLHVPISDESKHYVMFDHQQIARSAPGREGQDKMSKWIAEHAKEAQRSPSSRKEPHRCPVEAVPAPSA